MSRFKFVTFDVTHTLLQFRSSVGSVYSEAASVYGLSNNLNRDTMDKSFKKHFKLLLKEYPNFGACSKISSEEWWSIIVEKTLRECMLNEKCLNRDILNKISKHLFHLYSRKECWTILPGVTGLLNKLKKNNVKLGVISNFDERLEDVLISNQLRPYFDVVLASYCVKIEKPNKGIFDMALERVNLSSIKPLEALHIGDNVELDYEGARNAGWNALLLVNPNEEEKINKEQYDIAYSVVDIEKKILTVRKNSI